MESLYKLLQPHALEDVIGNTRAVNLLHKVIDHTADGTCPNILFTGPTGTGKSALAKLTKRLVLAKRNRNTIIEAHDDAIDAVVPEKSCADISYGALKQYLLGEWSEQSGFLIYVLGEADHLEKKQRGLLLTELERVRKPEAGRAFFLSLIDPIAANWDSALFGRFPILVRTEPLLPKQREALINQAFDDPRVREELAFAELDQEQFITAVNNHNLASPREIYNALDLYYSGMTAEEAVTARPSTQSPKLSDEDALARITELRATNPPTPWRAIEEKTGISKSTAQRLFEDAKTK